ncbi:MAG: hypothetical protein WCK98_07975 [bacterium]
MAQALLSDKNSEPEEKGFVIVDKKGLQTHSKSSKLNPILEIKSEDFLKMQERVGDLEQKIYPHIDLIQKQVGRLNNLILALSSILVVIVGSYLITGRFSSSNQSVAGTDETIVVGTPVDTSKFDQIAITKFAGNAAINETGSKISVTQSKITTINHSNCQTPIIPPETNGCGFVIIPNLLGLPKKGIILTTIQINGQINGNSLILVHQKNYQKGTIEKEVTTLDNSQLSSKIPLPSDLNSSNGLYFRLWDKAGQITISSIILNFSNINDLNTVNGKLTGDTSLYTKQARIYADTNENGVFDPLVDKVWSAKTNFTGIKPVTFDKDGNFRLLRDETSLKLERPENWKTDDFRYSLPPGKWLMVFEDTGIASSFDIQTKSSELQIDLKI